MVSYRLHNLLEMIEMSSNAVHWSPQESHRLIVRLTLQDVNQKTTISSISAPHKSSIELQCETRALPMYIPVFF